MGASKDPPVPELFLKLGLFPYFWYYNAIENRIYTLNPPPVLSALADLPLQRYLSIQGPQLA